MSDVSGARDCSTRLKSTSIKGKYRVANDYLRNICVALSQWGFNIIVHPDVVTSRQILLKTTLLKVFVEWPSNLRVELNATVRVGRIQVRLGLDFTPSLVVGCRKDQDLCGRQRRAPCTR